MSDTSLTTTAEAADAAASIVPPHIRTLLGEPPLLRGESKEEFNALLEQFAVDANPKDFASWLLLCGEGCEAVGVRAPPADGARRRRRQGSPSRRISLET